MGGGAAKEAARELARARAEVGKLNESLKAERAKLAAQRAATRALEESAAQEVSRLGRAKERGDKAERRATAAEVSVAELARGSEALTVANGELTASLAEAREKLAELSTEQRHGGSAAEAADAPVRNSNFVRVMNMQQEIAQLKAYITRLDGGPAFPEAEAPQREEEAAGSAAGTASALSRSASTAARAPWVARAS